MIKITRYYQCLIVSFLLITILLGCTSGLFTNKKIPPNYGQRKQVTFDTLSKNFKNPDMIYAPFIFLVLGTNL